MKPLCIDLFCGCFGWSAGWLELGGYVVGFDLEHLPHHGPVPKGADLALQNALTLHGKQFRDAALIVASPPCQFFSYCSMPWSKAKKLAADVRADPVRLAKELALFNACFRIQREASEAAGHHIPMVVENVRGAIPWVGRSRGNFGSFHLWGDVPALMPMTRRFAKVPMPLGYDSLTVWFQQNAKLQMANGQKVPGFRFDGSGKSFQSASVEGCKNTGGSWFNIDSPGQKEVNRNPVHEHQKTAGLIQQRDGHGHTRHLTNQAEHDGVKQGGDWFRDGISLTTGSKSNARKAASAQIAKIPFALSQYIAKVYFPSATSPSEIP